MQKTFLSGQATLAPSALGDPLRRLAERARHHLKLGVLIEDFQTSFRGFMRSDHTNHILIENLFSLARWQLRSIELLQQCVDELAVVLGNRLINCVDDHPFVFIKCVGGDHQVHAAALIFHMRVELIVFDLQLLSRNMRRTEHAHTAYAADSGDQIAELRKCKNRSLQSNGFHRFGLNRFIMIYAAISEYSLTERPQIWRGLARHRIRGLTFLSLVEDGKRRVLYPSTRSSRENSRPH